MSCLGTGLRNPGQVTGEVDRILQNNYKSSINKAAADTRQSGWVGGSALVGTIRWGDGEKCVWA
jgi:hypothetical protein